MKPKKEYYRQKLPHFQQPGQRYSVTVSLEGAMPKGAMVKYSLKLINAKNQYPQLLNKKPSPSRDMDFPKSMIFSNDQNNFDSGKSQSRQPWETDFPKSIIFSNDQNNFDLGKSKSQIAEAKKVYFAALRNYRLAYDKFLHKSTEPTISLTKPTNRIVIEEALHFWERKKLHSHVWCIMSNHFHWVLSVFEKDEYGEPIYLQDILHSVK